MKINLIIILILIISGCSSSGDDLVPLPEGAPSSEALKGTWYSPAMACSFGKKTASLSISNSTINKGLYTMSLTYYDDTSYMQFLYDVDIKEKGTENNIITFNYSASGNRPSGGSGNIFTSSLIRLSSTGLELSNACTINESLFLIQDTNQVLNLSLANHEQETSIIRNAYLQSFDREWATIYTGLTGRGVAESQACGARSMLFESYLQSMINDIFTSLLKYSPLNLPSNWYYPIYDNLKALDLLEAQYSQNGTPCTLLPDVELYYQFLYR